MRTFILGIVIIWVTVFFFALDAKRHRDHQAIMQGAVSVDHPTNFVVIK